MVDFLVPRLVGKDINEMWKLDNPMGLLNALLQSRGMASPESRYNKYTLVLEFKRCRQSHETNIFSLKKSNDCSAEDFWIFLKSLKDHSLLVSVLTCVSNTMKMLWFFIRFGMFFNISRPCWYYGIFFPRLLWQTGCSSIMSLYHVGIYSNKELIGKCKLLLALMGINTIKYYPVFLFYIHDAIFKRVRLNFSSRRNSYYCWGTGCKGCTKKPDENRWCSPTIHTELQSTNQITGSREEKPQCRSFIKTLFTIRL